MGLNGHHPAAQHKKHVEGLGGAVHPEAGQGGWAVGEPHAPQGRQGPPELHAPALFVGFIGHFQLDATAVLQAPAGLDRQLLGRR